MGVSTNAPNLAVYGDFNSQKYWCRLSIAIDDGLPMYLKEAYLLAKNNNLNWYKNLVNIMKSTDLD